MIVLGRRLAIACVVLELVPLPGVGAMIAGWKNPQTRLLRNGALQAALVVAGAWPLIVPAVIGFVWAAFDAARIHREARPPGAMSRPTPEHAADQAADPAKGRKARGGHRKA